MSLSSTKPQTEGPNVILTLRRQAGGLPADRITRVSSDNMVLVGGRRTWWYRNLLASMWTPRSQDEDAGEWTFSPPTSPEPPGRAVIYRCYGGTHTSVVAAAIHLGLLPHDRRPTAEELYAVPHFDAVLHRQVGGLLPFGSDPMGCRVYALGLVGADADVLVAVTQLLQLSGYRPWETFLPVSLGAAGSLLRLGGFLSRHLNVPRLGRPLLFSGVQRAYFSLVRLTDETRNLMRENASPVGRKE